MCVCVSVHARTHTHVYILYRYTRFNVLQRYLLDLVLPLYETVRFDDKLEDPHLEQRKRKIAVNWACKLGHKDCLDKVLTLYRQWMANPDNSR